jgi:predicted short-subunit dehydrogenase-like oxidoreductase (DUF2520 family)
VSWPCSVVVLGAGRLGCALRLALEAAGISVAAHWTRSTATAEAARSEGFDVVTGGFPEALRTADLVCLAVSDGALAGLSTALAASGLLESGRPAQGVTVLHHAGAADLGPLAPLSSLAPIGSLHPLVSVASRRTALAGGACAVEASDDATAQRIEELARRLSLHPLRWRGDRARYHAAACLVGNFPQALMAAAIRIFEEGGVDARAAREALGPLLLSASRNAVEREGGSAFSGPVVRGDVEVVRRHLSALDAPELADVEALYRAASKVAAVAVDGPRRELLEALLAEGR